MQDHLTVLKFGLSSPDSCSVLAKITCTYWLFYFDSFLISQDNLLHNLLTIYNPMAFLIILYFCTLYCMYTVRAGRAFLQALRVTRARVLSFPLRVPRSRVLFQSFFFAYQDSRSKFCNVFQFRVLKKKIFACDISPKATLSRTTLCRMRH